MQRNKAGANVPARRPVQHKEKNLVTVPSLEEKIATAVRGLISRTQWVRGQPRKTTHFLFGAAGPICRRVSRDTIRRKLEAVPQLLGITTNLPTGGLNSSLLSERES